MVYRIVLSSFLLLVLTATSTSFTSEGRKILKVGDIWVKYKSSHVYQSHDKRCFLVKNNNGDYTFLSDQEAYDALLFACQRAGIAYFKEVTTILDRHRQAHLLPELCNFDLVSKNGEAKKND